MESELQTLTHSMNSDFSERQKFWGHLQGLSEALAMKRQEESSEGRLILPHQAANNLPMITALDSRLIVESSQGLTMTGTFESKPVVFERTANTDDHLRRSAKIYK